MLRIGEFARLARVSTRMLRHYDALGLLHPIYVHPITRYRYYGIDQLPRVRRIAALRELAFQLDDIRVLLDTDEAPHDLRQLLRRKQRELRQRIADDTARVQRIEARLGALEEDVMEGHHERDALAQVLRDQYGIVAVKLELVYAGMPQKYIARHATGRGQDVYLARTEALGDNLYNGWLEGYSGHPVTDYLLERAGLLLQLEAQHYPTQRVVRTRGGDVLGAWGGWSVLVTTTLPRVAEQSVTQICHGMGVALGRLHLVPSTPDAGVPIGTSWYYPEPALREALHYLVTARGYVPAHWHPLLAAFHGALSVIERRPLPRALIHGDPYIARAAQADDGSLTFDEWGSGGQGVAVLDLGRLLYACHLNPEPQWPWTIAPSATRIGAVMAGYQERRKLSDLEQASLLEAIQFGIGYGAALHLANGLTTGWTPNLEVKLAARRQWFDATGEVARIARAQVA